jgi:hypothetical protein
MGHTALCSALWMREHLPGSIIPDAVIDRLARAGDPKAEGKRICIELLQELTQIPAVSGAHIMAVTGTHLWADRIDGSLEDVFELQDQGAKNVAGVIEPALQDAETARSASRPTNDLTAYDLYLRACVVGQANPRGDWIFRRLCIHLLFYI